MTVCWLADSDADQLDNIGAERWKKALSRRVAMFGALLVLFQLINAKTYWKITTAQFYIPFIISIPATVKREYRIQS